MQCAAKRPREGRRGRRVEPKPQRVAPKPAGRTEAFTASARSSHLDTGRAYCNHRRGYRCVLDAALGLQMRFRFRASDGLTVLENQRTNFTSG